MLGFSKMPKGVGHLHWINGISTFSYAVMFSSLSLYLTNKLGFSKFESNAVVGLFLALNFALHLVAGYVGGRYLGNRALLFIAIFSQICGIFILSLGGPQMIFLALSMILIGCGFGSTNLNCLLTQRFNVIDNKREVAFYYNYCAINFGFFTGFIAGGYFELQQDYKYLFMLCNVFNLIALILLIFAWKYLPEKGLAKNKINSFFPQIFGLSILILLIPLMIKSFNFAQISNEIILIIGCAILSAIFILAMRSKDHIERNRIYAFLTLTVSSIIFWTLFYIGPIGLVHFLESNVNTNFYGYSLAPQWIMDLNSIFVIICSPILATLFFQLKKRGHNVPVSKKFVLALLFIAASFFVLSIGVKLSDAQGYTSLCWVIAHFFLQAIGELLLAPVGNAMIGEIAPVRLQGILMGAWMMVSGIAAVISHHFSNMMTKSESLLPLLSNHDYLETFNKLGNYTILAALLLLLSTKLLDFWNTGESAVLGNEGA